jgi:hypothetical protein
VKGEDVANLAQWRPDECSVDACAAILPETESLVEGAGLIVLAQNPERETLEAALLGARPSGSKESRWHRRDR